MAGQLAQHMEQGEAELGFVGQSRWACYVSGGLEEQGNRLCGPHSHGGLKAGSCGGCGRAETGVSLWAPDAGQAVLFPAGLWHRGTAPGVAERVLG